MRRFSLLAASLLGLSFLVAAPCAHAQATSVEQVLGGDMPSASVEVRALKAAPGERVTLRGRIAYAKDAFANDAAVFTMVDDASAAACSPKDRSLRDSCPLGAELKVTVRLEDSAGKPFAGSLVGKGGLTHGAEVFVTGTVSAADAKGVVVKATRVHVPKVSVPMGLFVAAPRGEVMDVSKARAKGGFKKGDRVTLHGTLGGSKQPFVAGRAMFTLIGEGATSCAAMPAHSCETPWDYCCTPSEEIAANTVTVRVVNEKGQMLKTDLKGRGGLKELSDVIVTGTVAVSDKGSLVVDASEMVVK